METSLNDLGNLPFTTQPSRSYHRPLPYKILYRLIVLSYERMLSLARDSVVVSEEPHDP